MHPKKKVLKIFPKAVCLEDHYSDLFLVYSSSDFPSAARLTSYLDSKAIDQQEAWKEALKNIARGNIKQIERRRPYTKRKPYKFRKAKRKDS